MKKLVSLIIIAMLSLGMIAFIAPSVKAADPIMYAEPATKTYSYPVWPGTNPRWNFSIYVNNMAKILVVACDVKSVDPTKAIVRAFYQGNNTWGTFTYGSWDPVTGDVFDLTLGTTVSKDITTPLEAFKIEVEGLAFTDPSGVVIDIYRQYAGDEDLNDILSGDCPNDHTVYLNQITVAPYPPTAAFTWLPVLPYAGDPITFDASASLDGYDGENNCPITGYSWDWDNDGTFDDVNVSSPTIVHSFTPAASYPVKLEVYAPAGVGGNVSYVPTDDVTHDVMVYPKTTGRAIDLYTQDWRYPGYHTDIIGLAPALSGSQVDSYSPQDLVCLYVKLTYNGEPIANKEVEIEVDGPWNTYQNITLYRQAFTNGSGIAEICFRIPWPDLHAEAIIFGGWSALAKASVANVEIYDWHWWLVHWMVDIIDETALPNPVYETNTLTVTIWVKNWALTPRNFTFTATLYDELGVPVGSAVDDIVNAPSGDSGPYSVTIFVPEWAYVGVGTVYKNLFTKMPWDCGVCWCPEYSESVVISPTDPHVPPF